MQIVKSSSNIVEKVIRDKEGRLVRATFQIYENAGRIKARLIDFVYITAGSISGKVSDKFFSLSSKTKSFSKKVLSFYKNVEYVFPSSKILYSIGSKPRAPTLI